MNNSCVNLQGYCNRGCDMYNFRQTDVNAFFFGWLVEIFAYMPFYID